MATVPKSLKLGLIVHLEDVYGLGRNIFCTSEKLMPMTWPSHEPLKV